MNQQDNGQFTVYPTAADVPRYQRAWVWGLAALGILSCGILAGGLLGATLAPSATGPYAGPVAMHPTAAQLRARIEQLEQALAEQKNNASPGPRDIIGGLGWIFGLAAAGALYYKRGKGN